MQSNYSLLLTCQSGLESLVRRESEKLGLQKSTGQDRIVQGFGNLATLMRLCMGSRFANKLYLVLGEERITDFDTLFSLMKKVKWNNYLNSELPIIVDASSTRSALGSIPTIQSIGQKALFESFEGKGKNQVTQDSGRKEIHVLILIIDDIARIMLDVTGEALHKRGYRAEQGEAPIKETLAAGLVAMSGWKYKESLWDPFCGSGTIAIEAALMARNIAPGLTRTFRFMDLPFFDSILYENIKEEFQEKEFTGKYTIFASDKNPELIAIAKRNALRAGVREDIHFECEDFLESNNNRGIIVTNPPYGNRLKEDSISDLYNKLIKEVLKDGGGFITSFPVDIRHGLANKKLLNGSEECRFWYKK